MSLDPRAPRTGILAMTMLALLGTAAFGQTSDQPPKSDAAPTAAADSTAPHQMTKEEKYKAPLPELPDEVGFSLPLVMSLDDPKYAKLFPLAISTENPSWYTLGPGDFLVFKYPKSEPFRDRTGRFIRPPGSSRWAYLVAEDSKNYFFQWIAPGEKMSEEFYAAARTKKGQDLRRAQEENVLKQGQEEGKKLVDLHDFLGVPGWDVPKTVITPPEVDVLDFTERSRGLPRSGLWQLRVALADVNEDGFLDVIAPPARKQIGAKPAIWLGDGKGGWTYWENMHFPAKVPFDYGAVGVADFDGDGHMDLALAMHFKGVYILYGNGKGDFTDYFKFFDGSGFSSRALTIGDFDRDGHPDLALLSEISMDPKTQQPVIGRMLRVFLYRARDRYEPRDDGTTPFLIGDDLTTGDFNRDGYPDIVTASHVWGHTGILHLNEKEKGWKIWKEKLLGSCYYWSVAAGDVDGDGWDDLVVGFSVIERSPDREQGGIAILYNQAGKGLGEPQYVLLHKEPMPYFHLTLGDVDRDGRTDIVAGGEPEGKLRILLQREKGKFFLEKSPEMPTLISQGVHIADINHDGWPDLLVNYSSEEMGGAIKCWMGGPAEAQ